MLSLDTGFVKGIKGKERKSERKENENQMIKANFLILFGWLRIG